MLITLHCEIRAGYDIFTPPTPGLGPAKLQISNVYNSTKSRAEEVYQTDVQNRVFIDSDSVNNESSYNKH